MRRESAFALLLFACAAHAQDGTPYPTKPIRFVVPFAAGSATDSLARVVGADLGGALGTVVIVENRAGSNGLIAAETVAKSVKDGYTLLVATNTTHSANPSLYKYLPYDPVRDFTPIGRLTAGQFLLITHGSLGVKTVHELTALAKASPGKLSYATSNSTSLVSAEWFKALAGIDIVGVPYKSNPTALADVVAGRVPLMFADYANAVPLARGGKVQSLASTGDRRGALTPETPTMRESGFPQFVLASWAGLFAPAGTPRAIIDRLDAMLARTLAKQEIVAKLNAFGYEVVSQDSAAFSRFVGEQIDQWALAIRAARIQPE